MLSPDDLVVTDRLGQSHTSPTLDLETMLTHSRSLTVSRRAALLQLVQLTLMRHRYIDSTILMEVHNMVCRAILPHVGEGHNLRLSLCDCCVFGVTGELSRHEHEI